MRHRRTFAFYVPVKMFLGAMVMLLAMASASAAERISSFDVTIRVADTGVLEIVERITANVEHREITRGINRDLKLVYTDLSGKPHTAAFEVQAIQRNGSNERWERRTVDDTLRLRIGNPGRVLPVGEHTWEIRYRTDYQLDFAPDTDTLYWNITGSRWTLPIDRAVVELRLPPGPENVEFTGFTGPPGSRERDIKVRQAAGIIEAVTTRTLTPGEGLTIVARWPAGFVERPEGFARFRKSPVGATVTGFIENILGNGIAVMLAIGAFLLTLYRRFRPSRVRDSGEDVVSAPPAGISPAATRWLRYRKLDSRTLAAAIVSLAVKGRIELIEDNAFGRRFRLRKLDPSTGPALSNGEQAVLKSLFERHSELVVGRQFESYFSDASDALRDALEEEHEERFFRDNTELVFIAAGASLVLIAAWLFVFPGELRTNWALPIAAFMAMAMVMIFASSIESRTPQGRVIQAQIDAFRDFLVGRKGDTNSFLEKDFEELLPYAVALDEGEAFARRAFTGMPAPKWYTGARFSTAAFAASIGEMDRYLNDGLSDSTRSHHEGSDAGFDDDDDFGDSSGGSSGGGGGGGGGSGW